MEKVVARKGKSMGFRLITAIPIHSPEAPEKLMTAVVHFLCKPEPDLFGDQRVVRQILSEQVTVVFRILVISVCSFMTEQ